ncbi:hypothetical protein ABVB69_08755 [Streptomyces sp. NPDC000349]|uniref:hypothetical protein n=1 Tax=unclassified Streptomyces TaxID=2593676 RepID=UPI00278553FA|nr:hypothetical protein [Streptomyces sp. DSM 40167]MDQ0405593.1 hypothetical protein [Streptomyces sp. DSM 40167]
MADDIPRTGGGPEWWRVDWVRWLLFSLVCAGGSLGLSWLGPFVPLPSAVRGVGGLLAILVLPLASLLVPLLTLRRVPRKKRKLAWQLVVPLVAGMAMGFLGTEAGGQAALAGRGAWTDAVVVGMDDSSTNHCDLRAADGQEISPSLSEGDGCEDWVEKGDEMRVRYDPEGIAGPTADRDSGSNGGLLAVLFGAAVVMGTWGGVRQSRWDREYDGS